MSTPQLLRSLSLSDARREAIVAMVPEVLRQGEAVIPEAMADDFVDRALARLAQDYPDHKDLFDQVSGSTDSREEIREDVTCEPPRLAPSGTSARSGPPA